MNDAEIILKLRNLFGLEEDESNERLIDLVDVLISENDRLEDIEDRKIQIEYNNVFNKGANSVKTQLQSIIRDYSTPKDNNYRYLSYNNIEPLFNKLEELIHKKET